MANVEGHLGDLLSAYLDGALTPAELTEVSAHLDTCLDCVADFRDLQSVKRAIRTLPMLQLPDRLLDDVHIGEVLSALLDGQLATGEHGVVVSHLERCERCRDELHEVDAARTAVRSLPVLEPPVPLLPALRHEETPHPLRKVVGWAAGVAAAAAVVVGVTVQGPTPAPVDLTSFAERHVARQSVDDGIQVVPAVFPLERQP